ncbi:hypothetical protein [Planococcus salinus]|uniref:Uncharacterized protein n=1 Tax=Planococcus salinus TaxID=1848460 RepID=A0A3M8P5S0_9BACL|nr:hypothetical protein [Planococcus salinus]RNF39028.1 hypothetical protein EEX84_11615 [Planococcus salinus]
MINLSVVSIFSFDFSFTSLMAGHGWIYIMAILVLGLSLVMRTGKIFLAQLMLLFAFYSITEIFSNFLFLALVFLQVALAVWMLIRIEMEVEQSYNRHLEKTHQLPRNVTKGGNAGIRHYRF